MNINPTTMRVKVDHHDIPATGPGMWDGLVATLRTYPGNHCLAAFRGIDGATRLIEGEAADRFAAAWNLCQCLPLEVLTEMAKPKSALLDAMKMVLNMAKSHVADIESSLEDTPYETPENIDLPQKQAAVAFLVAALQAEPVRHAEAESSTHVERGGDIPRG